MRKIRDPRRAVLRALIGMLESPTPEHPSEHEIHLLRELLAQDANPALERLGKVEVELEQLRRGSSNLPGRERQRASLEHFKRHVAGIR